jgi:nitrite reductase/ring-hydroxylating ferredoxin subunit
VPRWVRVDVAGLAPGEVRAVAVAGRDLLLCHAEGGFYALENRCPHAATSLAGGRLRGFVLECPLHGGKLDVRDGRPCALPIRSPAAAFAVRRAGDAVEIGLDDPRPTSTRCAGADRPLALEE